MYIRRPHAFIVHQQFTSTKHTHKMQEVKYINDYARLTDMLVPNQLNITKV